MFSRGFAMSADFPKVSSKTRVLIVDDQPLMREGMASLLARLGDFQVCGAADSIGSARRQMAELAPQLVVMELNLGTGDTMEFLKSCREEFEDSRILIYTSLNEKLFVERALHAGASGYLMKHVPAEHFVEAVRAVASGELYVSKEISALMLRRSVGGHVEARSRRDTALDNLTDRELHIFRLLGSGLSTRNIAENLNLSVKTVEAHREHIKQKLGFVSGPSLIQMAMDWVRETLPPSRPAES